MQNFRIDIKPEMSYKNSGEKHKGNSPGNPEYLDFTEAESKDDDYRKD
jgi:hypothetical protein